MLHVRLLFTEKCTKTKEEDFYEWQFDETNEIKKNPLRLLRFAPNLSKSKALKFRSSVFLEALKSCNLLSTVREERISLKVILMIIFLYYCINHGLSVF